MLLGAKNGSVGTSQQGRGREGMKGKAGGGQGGWWALGLTSGVQRAEADPKKGRKAQPCRETRTETHTGHTEPETPRLTKR